MADIAASFDMESSYDTVGAVSGRFAASTAPGVAYAWGMDETNADMYYTKYSSDSFAAKTLIDGTVTVEHCAGYYDKWTRNVTTTKILFGWLESVSDTLIFNALDVSDDTLDGEVTAHDPSASVKTTSGYQNTKISMVRAEGGNIYAWALHNGDVTAVQYFVRSTDGGLNWTARSTTNLWETREDRIYLMPGNKADTNDIYALYYDDSAGEFTVKVYDDSANTWAEGTASVGSLETTVAQTMWGFGAAQRHSDGHIIVALPSEFDAAEAGTADLLVIDITSEDSFSSLTNVITNSDDFYYADICINQQNDDLYVVYAGQADGSEALNSAVNVYYDKSTDDGSTWTGEVLFNEDGADDVRATCSMTSIGDDGGDMRPIWFNDDLNDLFTNAVNEVAIAAVGGATSYAIPHRLSATRNRLLRR